MVLMESRLDEELLLQQRLLSELKLPRPIEEALGHFIADPPLWTTSERVAYFGDTHTAATRAGVDHCSSTARQVSEGSCSLSVRMMPFFLFRLMERLHFMIRVLQECCVDRGTSNPVAALTAAMFTHRYNHVVCDVVPTVVVSALNLLCARNLDQTFGLADIRRGVGCVCDNGYIENELATNTLWTNIMAQYRACSNAALLLLQMIHAAATGEENGAHTEGADKAATTTTTTPPWLSAVWDRHARNKIVVFTSDNGNDAHAMQSNRSRRGVVQPSPATSSNVPTAKRTRSGRLTFKDSVEVGAPLRCRSAERVVRRTGGIVPLPVELQFGILQYLFPRHLVSAACTCFMWQRIILTTPTLFECLRSSRRSRDVYHGFFIDDWGEKYLDISDWVLHPMTTLSTNNGGTASIGLRQSLYWSAMMCTFKHVRPWMAEFARFLVATTNDENAMLLRMTADVDIESWVHKAIVSVLFHTQVIISSTFFLNEPDRLQLMTAMKRSAYPVAMRQLSLIVAEVKRILKDAEQSL